MRSYQSQAVEQRIQEFAQSKPPVWCSDSFEYCYPNTLDERICFSYRTKLPFAYISANDGYMHLDDSTRQALIYLDLILIDSGIEKLIAGVINCQMLHIRQNAYRSVISIPEGKCLYADRTRTDNYSIPDLSHEKPASISQTFEIWDQSLLCAPVCLIYDYWKAGADMNLLSSDWRNVLKLCIGQFDDPAHKYVDLIYPVIINGYSQVYDPCQEMQSVRISANILIASSLAKLAELCTIDRSLNDLIVRCLKVKQEISVAINVYASVNHSTFGTIYASEIDKAGNKVCMEKIDLNGLIALPFTDISYLTDPVYQQTRNFCLSRQNVLYQHTDMAGLGLSRFHSLVTTALTTKDPGELDIEINKIKEFIADTGKEPDLNGEPIKKLVFNQNTLFAELILHLRRINPRLLA